MLSRVRNLHILRLPLKWLHQLVPNRYVTVRVLRGMLRGRYLVLNLRYQMGYWLGLTEPDLRDALVEMIAPGDVVYDIGAEVGYFAVMAAVISKTGPVYAFEPNPANLAVLNQNAVINHDLNLTIVSQAVGDMRRQAEFLTFAHRDDVTNASLLGRLSETSRSEVRGKSVLVSMVDLDSFSAETKVMPDIIKIDVEGAEGLVLQGMPHLLVSVQPRLVIEIHNQIAERDVMDCLTAHGYGIRKIGRTFDTPYPFRVVCVPASEDAPPVSA